MVNQMKLREGGRERESEREKVTTELRRIIIVKTDEQNENESADSCSAMRDEAGKS